MGPAQELIESHFFRVQPCCVPATDGLTMPLRGIVASGRDLRRPDIALMLQDTLAEMPASNILVEDRFARVRQHLSSSNGHPVHVATLASNHVLSEVKSMYEVKKRRFLAFEICDF